MKLTHIRHLVAVAEEGDLASAAVQLGVSPHALIRSIRTLEQELGAALFTRAKGSMTLTPVGEIFVRRAAAAQLELDRASQDLSRALAAPAELLTIGMCEGALVSILPKVLAPFQARFPNIPLHIVERDQADLERGGRDGVIDVYVGPISQTHPAEGLRIDRLCNDTRIVVGRKGHPLASATSLTELADARWIAASRSEIDPLFALHDLPSPFIAVEAHTGLGSLAAVAASDALLILTAIWLPLIERAGLLTALRLKELLSSPSIYLVTRTQPLAPATACLRDLVLELFPGDRAGGIAD